MKHDVTDTTGLIRHLAKSEKLGKDASKIFEEADTGGCVVFIPAMVLMEILYLSEKIVSQRHYPMLLNWCKIVQIVGYTPLRLKLF